MLRLIAAALMSAQAATFSAAADSPQNPDLPPAEDISRVVSTLDGATGTWTVTVSLRGEPVAGTTSAAVNATLFPPGAACGTADNAAIAYLRGNDSPDATDVSGPIAFPWHTPDGGYFKEHVPGSATITLAMKDSSFVGYTPGCVTVKLGRHGFVDEIDAVPFAAPGQPAPPLTPLPPPAPPQPAGPTIAFLHTSLKATNQGDVFIQLKPFDRDVTGKVVVADRKGHTLGSKGYSATLGKAVTVKVRLNPTSRRTLRTAGRLKVALTATVGTTLKRRTNATVRAARR